MYASSDKLPQVLFDPVKGQSDSDLECAFQEAHNTKLSWWDWLEQPIEQPDGTIGPRPELALFGLAMLGGGRAQGPPLYAGPFSSF